MDKVRWGVLSTAKIGTNRVIPAMQNGKNCEVSAIASRQLDKAQAVAKELGIAKAFGSYEELIADPAIDAIYNPLPNHLHVSWTIKALKAGKHVLCEKPIGLSSAEGQEIVDEAEKRPQLKVMEAFMYRHHPQWQKARQLIKEGKIGDLRMVQSVFSFFNVNADDIRNKADLGGGGLMDIGCYNVSLSRFIYGSEPKRVCGIMEIDPQFKTDRLVSAILDFGCGTAVFTCSTQLSRYQRVNIFGTEGRVELENINYPVDEESKLWLQRDNDITELSMPKCDHYGIQCDQFSLAIMNDTEVFTPIEDAIANMKVLEAIVQSATDNTWVSLRGS
jgi:predicted dehydrogenase